MLLDYYRQLIDGRRRGLIPSSLRAGLWSLSLAWRAGNALRGWSYRSGLRRQVHVGVPVISVGNLTMGGTGKTPMVQWLAHQLSRMNLSVAILAHGYGPGGDDELLPADLAAEGIVRHAGRHRADLARRVVVEQRPDVILLDDGFQHRRLHRDLDILLIDALDPISNGHLPPRGLLREPPSAARRADWIVVTRADQAGPRELERLALILERTVPGVPVARARHRAVELRNLWNGRLSPPEALDGRPVYGFCGIGNPEGFRRTVAGLGAQVTRFRAYRDHHAYTPRDLRQIDAEAQEFLAETLVTTEKDAGKLDSDAFTLTPLALKVELEFLEGQAALWSAVRALLPQTTEIRQA